MMSPLTSPVVVARFPYTRVGVGVLLLVKDIVFDAMIGRNYLLIDESLSKNTESGSCHVFLEAVAPDNQSTPHY